VHNSPDILRVVHMIVRTVDIRVLVLMRAISAVRQAGWLSRTSKRSACDSVHYTSLFRAATMSPGPRLQPVDAQA